MNHSGVGDLIQMGPGTYFENVSIVGATLTQEDQLTLQGDLTTGSTVNGNGAGPVFGVGGGHTATFRNLTITNGHAGDAVGGAGGGITTGGDTTITVIGCTISGNTADGVGGAGAGIYNHNGGTLTVINSTITGNVAAGSSGQGGGIDNDAILIMANCTIAGNTSSNSIGGGIYNSSIGTLSMTNTIIAGNSGGDCLSTASIGTNDHNLVQDGSCSPALSGNPKLGPLASNGGPTLTQALLAGSPAIDAGDDSVIGNPFNLTTDQRGVGFPRKVSAHVDIGAYESVAPPTITCPSNITVMLSPGQTTASVTFAATAVDPRDGPLTPVYEIGSTVITSPNTFGVGTTTVSVSATDSLSLTATCSFTVTVVCAPPTITCPGNITAFSDPGRATATVSFGASASDACDGTLTPVYTIGNRVITSPFMFPPGMTTVTATATGSNGLAGSCTFTVAVALLNECIQDDHSGDTFRFNSTTGQYVYTRCKDK
ncbi:MAG: choice-of-anchor Q domain-containing protein, partial [Blastocatellia bacterium]